MGGGASKTGAKYGSANSRVGSVGIKASFLLKFMAESDGGKASFAGKTTEQVIDQIRATNALLGADIYTDVLKKTHKEGETGQAQWFVVHRHQAKFTALVDAILQTLEYLGLDPDATILWIDIFSSPQTAAAAALGAAGDEVSSRASAKSVSRHPQQWWLDMIAAVGGMNNALIVANHSDLPVLLGRAFCLFEIYSAVKESSRLELCMSNEDRKQFWNHTVKDPAAFLKVSSSADLLRRATTCSPADKDAILEAVTRVAGKGSQEAGVAEVNSSVQRGLNEWVVAGIEAKIDAKEKAKDDTGVAALKGALGKLFMSMGDTNKAKFMLERSLSMKQKVKRNSVLATKRDDKSKKEAAAAAAAAASADRSKRLSASSGMSGP